MFSFLRIIKHVAFVLLAFVGAFITGYMARLALPV